ncbi:MAG: RluA family pseudouridine synthase [Anaerolineae bacterium]
MPTRLPQRMTTESPFPSAKPSSPEPEARVHTWTVDDLAEGDHPRLDRYLAAHFSDFSRSAVQRWIAEGLVQVDGRPAKPSQKVAVGQRIQVVVPPPAPEDLVPEPRPLDILYEDADLVLLNKPPGEVVHPAPGHSTGTLVQALLAHCTDLTGVGGRLRPGIVHRLDKDTSGVLLVAKNDRAFRALQEQFKAREVRKFYLVLVHGHPRAPAGRIEAPIGRDPHSRQRMAVVPGGRPAVTRYRVLRTVGPYTLVLAQPVTGRTHQVRVHLAFLGHPVAGDTLYGPRRASFPFPRQFLHAWCLGFRHPSTGEWMEVRAPLSADLRAVLRALLAEEHRR